MRTPTSRLGSLLVTGLIGLSLSLSVTSRASAQVYDDSTSQPGYGVSGTVFATAIVGDTVFVGGKFLKVHTTSGTRIDRQNLAAFSLSTGELLTSWTAGVDDTVRALATDGTSLYVGGRFLNASGEPRMRIAKFDAATGNLDPAFHPTFSGGVKAIDVDGSDLYVGGGFGTVSGTRHQNIVKLDTATGAVSGAFQATTDRAVWCLVKSPAGNTLWVGGLFEFANGQPRLGIGGLDSDTGALVGPEFGHTDTPVYGLDISPDGGMLFAAQKSNQGGGWRVSDGERRWVVRMDGNAQAAKYFDGNVYFGFHDGYQGDVALKLLSADAVTGAVDPDFRPTFDRFMGVHAIDATANKLVVGGQWDNASGVARKNIAVFSP